MTYLTRRIHAHVDRTLAPSTASLQQLRDLAVPRVTCGLAASTSTRSIRAFATRDCAARSHRTVGFWSGTSVGWRPKGARAPDLPLSDPRYALVIVGGGPEEARLRRLLPDATFLGVLHGTELGRAYASLDVFVHTGRHETYCQSAQEALASGVPVVAPRSGGPIDVVRDTVAGFLYEPGDGDDLGGYVDRLARDAEFRVRMGYAARRSVEGRSWSAVNRALVEHYRSVIADRTRPTPSRLRDLRAKTVLAGYGHRADPILSLQFRTSSRGVPVSRTRRLCPDPSRGGGAGARRAGRRCRHRPPRPPTRTS